MYDDSGHIPGEEKVASGLWNADRHLASGNERCAGGRDRLAGSAGCEGIAGARRDHLDPCRGRSRRPSRFGGRPVASPGRFSSRFASASAIMVAEPPGCRQRAVEHQRRTVRPGPGRQRHAGNLARGRLDRPPRDRGRRRSRRSDQAARPAGSQDAQASASITTIIGLNVCINRLDMSP